MTEERGWSLRDTLPKIHLKHFMDMRCSYLEDIVSQAR